MNIHLEEIIKQRTANIHQQKEELQTQRDEIERQNEYLSDLFDEISKEYKTITKSIKYAEKIHKAILPKIKHVTDLFTSSFILFKPKEILGGDFYWISKFNNNGVEKFIFSVADCTGHGVPGALMSIIGNNLLTYAVKECKLHKPSEILDNLQQNIMLKLHQDNTKSSSRDGMDLSVISYEPSTSLLEYSGARNNMYIEPGI